MPRPPSRHAKTGKVSNHLAAVHAAGEPTLRAARTHEDAVLDEVPDQVRGIPIRAAVNGPSKPSAEAPGQPRDIGGRRVDAAVVPDKIPSTALEPVRRHAL